MFGREVDEVVNSILILPAMQFCIAGLPRVTIIVFSYHLPLINNQFIFI